MGSRWGSARSWARAYAARLLIAGCAVVAGSLIAGCGSSTQGGGSEAASFVGRAGNAVVFIQWTQTGSHLAGSLQEAILRGEGPGTESQSRAFSGAINLRGVTLTLNEGLGGTRALAGTITSSGFRLTFTGTHHNLIAITFHHAGIGAYNRAAAQLEAQPAPASEPPEEPEPESSQKPRSRPPTGKATVKVVRCQTAFGTPDHQRGVPGRLAAGAQAANARLVAYTNTVTYLLGPTDMDCAGLVAADGGTQLILWPHGVPKPEAHASSSGLTLLQEPACAGCRAEEACPFFTELAAALGFPCKAGVPTGEDVSHLGSDVTLFEDPAGVQGSGWPSGGSDPANGLVGVTSSTVRAGVYRATCTLPASQHSVCTTILNYVIKRYG